MAQQPNYPPIQILVQQFHHAHIVGPRRFIRIAPNEVWKIYCCHCQRKTEPFQDIDALHQGQVLEPFMRCSYNNCRHVYCGAIRNKNYYKSMYTCGRHT